MIDTVNLVFAPERKDFTVQLLRRSQIIAKRFFDDDAPPACMILRATFMQACFVQAGRDHAEHRRRGSHVKEDVAVGFKLAVELAKILFEPFESLRIVKTALLIMDGGAEFGPGSLV